MPAPYNDKMPPTFRFPRFATRDEFDDLVGHYPTPLEVRDATDEPTEDARGADGADELTGGLAETGPTP